MQEIVDSLLPKHTKKNDSDWVLWEHKTLNIHRAILQWTPQAKLPYSAIHEQLRNKISEEYKVSWWRGFGFGVILNVHSIPDRIELIEDTVDIRDNRKGTCQWVIIVCQEPKFVIAVHTWMSTFLTPIYESLIAHYQDQGYNVADFKKEKDKMMKLLTRLSGFKGVHFHEYKQKDTAIAEQVLSDYARTSRG